MNTRQRLEQALAKTQHATPFKDGKTDVTVPGTSGASVPVTMVLLLCDEMDEIYARFEELKAKLNKK